jgi:hypothetical protein
LLLVSVLKKRKALVDLVAAVLLEVQLNADRLFRHVPSLVFGFQVTFFCEKGSGELFPFALVAQLGSSDWMCPANSVGVAILAANIP